jgi:hypothetical protein
MQGLSSFITCTLQQIKEIGMVCSTVRQTRNSYSLLGKLEGKRICGKPNRTWKGTIKTDLGETGWNGVEWIHLFHDTDHKRR